VRAAQRAEHVVRVSVLTQTGVLSAGSQLVDSTTGVIHLTTQDVALDDDQVLVPIRAMSDQYGGDGSGAIGNMSDGQAISFAAPLPNVARLAEIDSQTVTGADAETEDAYRARVLRRFQRRPQGGAYADYRDWAESVPGIARAWPYSGDPGEVDLFIEATEASSGDPDGIPTPAQITAVESAVVYDEEGLPYRRPACAQVNVVPIVRSGFSVEVIGLSAPGLEVDAQDAIEAALDDYLRSREPYIVGLSVLPRKDRVTLAGVSGAADDAVSAIGGTIVSVTLRDESDVEITAYTLQPGELAKLADVTFSEEA